jgi:hypothetical protein
VGAPTSEVGYTSATTIRGGQRSLYGHAVALEKYYYYYYCYLQRFAQMHEERLHHHENIEAIQLLDNMEIVRRLQRKKPFELV